MLCIAKLGVVHDSLFSRCNTSYKPKTLNPTWNEDFVLDVNSVEQVVLPKILSRILIQMFIYISVLLSLSLSHSSTSIIIFGIWQTKESLFEGLPPS